MRRLALVLAAVALGVASAPGLTAGAADPTVFEGPVPRAACGGTNDPFFLEPALQGQVPLADRQSGRSQLGYRCNLELVGQHQGDGAGWQNAWYDHCDYYDITYPPAALYPATVASPGTQVLDVADPAAPKLTAALTTNAMQGPWESLKVNQGRGLLGAVAAYSFGGSGPLYFDVYDVKKDCTKPSLLASMPLNVPIGHEGNFSADGLTYYGSSLATGTMAAIDVTDPTKPSLISVFAQNGFSTIHGLSTSDDGKRLYGTQINGSGGNGLVILDTSCIQARTSGCQPPIVGSVFWTDGSTAQHTIPITYQGHPYVYFVDEGGAGASRIIDIGDEKNPKVISKLKLEIHMPANSAAQQADTNGNGAFGYEGHYCAVDRQTDPTAMACGYFQSGVRVFDIRDPYHPREIAYYNPPAQTAKRLQLPGSEHAADSLDYTGVQQPNLTADWCSSQIRFNQAPDGTWMLWAQCQDNGFMTLRFTNGVYPLAPLNYNPIPSAATSTSNVAASPTTTALPFSSGPGRTWPLAALLVLLLGAAVATGAALVRRRA